MASTDNLIVSWNFDNLTSSNTVAAFEVSDTSNNYSGGGIDFNGLIVQKNDVKTFDKVNPETLESIDTIQVLEEDDVKISNLHKPSSLQLSIENSMYQIISDEMMNMFSNIEEYIFSFSRPEFKFEPSYKELDSLKHNFFSKILQKPDLEKYLEFYKWIDSSLGYLINQLLPESSNNSNGLKNTIESHILERNKFQHKLPLTIQPNRIYNHKTPINIIKTLKNSSKEHNLEDTISGTVNTENIFDYNYKNNYEVIQTAGKSLNNRSNKQNKTVFKTVFSSVDGLSELNRDSSGEFSIYNSLNNRAIQKKKELNVEESITGSNHDNKFVQINIPYTSSNYSTHNNYIRIPTNPDILDRRYKNQLIDKPGMDYETSADLIEPAIQFNIPLKQNLSLNNAFETIDIYSPYSNYVNLFNNRSLYHLNNVLLNSLSTELVTPDVNNTFYNKSVKNSSSFDFNKLERLEIVYPRNDKIGLAEVRYRLNYDEETGIVNTKYGTEQSRGIFDYNYIFPWVNGVYNNSYNNNSTIIRSFWRDNSENRKRTNGVEAKNLESEKSGSFNCLGYPNVSSSALQLNSFTHSVNFHNSMWSMDSNVDIEINNDLNNPNIKYTNEIYGDLAPYSHINLFYLSNVLNLQNNNKIYTPPKPSFIFNNFISASANDLRYFNKSYQDGIDCRIKPWYDNYDKFSENIKHKSQTYSVVPEFAVSNYREVIELQSYNFFIFRESSGIERRNYLTVNGQERNEQHNPETFKVDLKNFVDKNSNKVKIKIKAIKKLLPYNGFYPQQRTAQIAGIFSEDYLRSTGYINFNDPNHKSGTDENINIIRGLCVMQPLFAPGILFNTIKAGVAMPWPARRMQSLSEDSSSYKEAFENNIYNNVMNDTNFLQSSVEKLTHKLSFETLLEPINNISKLLPKSFSGNLYLFYLDPTNSSKQIVNNNENILLDNLIYAKRINVKTLIDTMKSSKGILYKSSINNFLSETYNFFIQKDKLAYFKSTIGDTVFVQSGSVYTMDVVLRKSPNFSQFFNKYTTFRNNIVLPESLYGPPVQYTASANDDNNHSSIYPYLPYAPPYTLENEGRVTLTYTAKVDGEVKLQDLIRNTKISYASGSIDNQALYWRTSVEDCVNLITFESGSWYIQTKFETPLINFNGCSGSYYPYTPSLYE